MGRPNINIERVVKLRQLCTAFATEATEIGKKIIAELHLPDDQKSIPPITR